jgi:hypothetical protein
MCVRQLYFYTFRDLLHLLRSWLFDGLAWSCNVIDFPALGATCRYVSIDAGVVCSGNVGAELRLGRNYWAGVH